MKMKKTNCGVVVEEADVQRVIIDLCGYLGWRVLKTSRVRKGCWHCGRYPRGGDGVTKGLPDLFVQPKSNELGALWLGVEVKGTHTRLSREQQALSDGGSIVVVRDAKEFYELIQSWRVNE